MMVDSGVTLTGGGVGVTCCSQATVINSNNSQCAPKRNFFSDANTSSFKIEFIATIITLTILKKGLSSFLWTRTHILFTKINSKEDT